MIYEDNEPLVKSLSTSREYDSANYLIKFFVTLSMDQIDVKNVRTKKQLGDIMTKALPKEQFRIIHNQLYIRSPRLLKDEWTVNDNLFKPLSQV